MKRGYAPRNEKMHFGIQSGGPSACKSKKGVVVPCLLGLPSEILTTIFEYSGEKSLCSLAGVCQQFHGMAVALLYRNVHHGIHTDDPVYTERSLDRFTAMVEVVSTSNLQYASSVKNIAVRHIAPYESDNRQGGVVKRPSQSYYTGRYLCSLIAITLRKTTGLTSFSWDIRLELTPSVYQAISQIPDIRDVHIRLPACTTPGATDSTLGQMLQTPHYHFHQNNPPPREIRPSCTGAEAQLLKDLDKLQHEPTLSLLSGLKNLSVLDIEDLKLVLQLPQCISQCSSTLKSLKLSFSDELAKSARKKTASNSAPDATTAFGDMLNFAAPQFEEDLLLDQQATPADPALPPDPVVRRERSIQESILAYIFKVGDGDRRNKYLQEALLEGNARKSQAEDSSASEEARDQKFLKCVRSMVRVLPKMMVLNSENPAIINVLHKLDQAATQYLVRNAKQPSENVVKASASNSASASALKPTPSISGKTEFSVSKKKEKCPTDVIDMEHPDVVEEEGEDQVFVDERQRSVTEASVRAFARQPVQAARPSSSADKGKGKQPVRNPPVEKRTAEEARECYVRNTHGIPLESLSIHLIPVTAGVLSKAVDLTSLHHLSLLNVGPQSTLWAFLKRLNQIYPLPLTSIHTDNVTPAFCSFVNSMDKITELFLFERYSKAKVESLAAKTTISAFTIRREILHKHMRNLQRLVIRNDESDSWAADPATILQISQRGGKLIELGVSVNNCGMHSLMQQIGSFCSLKALQVFWYRQDMCTTTLREVHHSLIDGIYHYWHLRIEYVAMCYCMHGPIANGAIQVRGRVRHLNKACAILKKEAAAEEAASSSSSSQPASTNNAPHGTMFPMENSEGDPMPLFGVELSTRALLSIEEISGVKMWEKGAWEMKL
ncbi:hypothetical protein AtubIFM55763_003098 [Aspergillus tubingensis]|uniref:F-box domain-containing protein n=2 Tax=Aspergillus subgen. Circumdati TaxID=2720871 RepID=A0A100I756_ASPNG|nr:uncharacterized protein AtWU_04015 [Aspergillus tubingensis]GAQ35919.1 hypothetical protein AKAW_04895 [Aspergillus niger]GFN14215.1 hypothetical protein AtWU_04015 [Aspergillus tubingensis]GLA72557.1 hypothetical protein AtubIFM55763_003098 [Aspergillus tubingensis]GLA88574.1 hypothetical protein AtubIFM56815_003032 [Aspergillus tubingensis]GLA98875.1 hypothetical protein AtubIFM57143_007172 [Aspergillus tubingensis]